MRIKTDKIDKAPWTSEQVDALKRRQANDMMHEYTCECSQPLKPTLIGWVCNACGLTQNWCFKADTEKRVECKGKGCDAYQQSTLGYLAHAFWAQNMGKTHKQLKCKICGLYTVWVKK